MKLGLCIAGVLFVTLPHRALAQDSVYPKGNKAANVHHSGDVWLSHISDADGVFDYNVVLATFAAGAKLDWHSHPSGQQLLVTEGIGFYQERGEPARVVRKGDVIKCLPGVEHWHAAAPDRDFAYLAITGNEPTQWLEVVSDETYGSIASPSAENMNPAAEIIALSERKWQWMADKEADSLAALFHDKAQFVHMGGSWGKDQEVEIIRSGGIHYKNADVHEVSVDVIGDTAILLNRITLLAVVGGNEVTNPFMVTEVYKKQDAKWRLANLSFTRLLTQSGE